MNERVDAYRLLIADVFELAGASRRTSEVLASEVGQTAARWHVMNTVAEGSATVPAVARRLGLARQSVQRVVNDLADVGMVTLEPNPNHARSSLIVLTDEGRKVLTVLFDSTERNRAALIDRAGLRLEELEAARATLRQLLSVFEADGA